MFEMMAFLDVCGLTAATMIPHVGALGLTEFGISNGLCKELNPLMRKRSVRMTIGLMLPVILPLIFGMLGTPWSLLKIPMMISFLICMADFLWDVFIIMIHMGHVRKHFDSLALWNKFRVNYEDVYGEKICIGDYHW